MRTYTVIQRIETDGEYTVKHIYIILSFYSTERNLFFFESYEFFESLTGAEHHKKVSKSYSLVRRAVIRIKYKTKCTSISGIEKFVSVKQNYSVKFPRYNVDSWLRILSEARPKFHPQHMIMIEIAKWLVPILCRGPGINISLIIIRLLCFL